MKQSSLIALAGALTLALGVQATAAAAPAAKKEAPAMKKTMKTKAKTKAAEGKCGEGKCGGAAAAPRNAAYGMCGYVKWGSHYSLIAEPVFRLPLPFQAALKPPRRPLAQSSIRAALRETAV